MKLSYQEEAGALMLRQVCRGLVLMFLSFQSSVLDVMPKGDASSSKRLAILVGVPHDPDPKAANPAPANDVARMRNVLESKFHFTGIEIHEIVGREATRTRLLDEFSTAIRTLHPGDVFVFYFTGHGMVLDDNYSINDPEPGPSGPGPDQALRVLGRAGKYSLVLDDELGALMRQIRAQRKVLIVDACFAGAVHTLGLDQVPDSASDTLPIEKVVAFQRNDTLLDFPKAFLSDDQAVTTEPIASEKEPDFAFVSGTAFDEPGWSFQEWPPPGTEANSMFTYYLARELGRSGDRQSLADVVRSASDAMQRDRYCARNRYCQHPVVRGQDVGRRFSELVTIRARADSHR